MKRSRLIIPLVALATMALMLSATGASADIHTTVSDDVNEPRTTCDVNGEVDLTSNNQNNDPSSGLDNEPGSNRYEFSDTELDCTGKQGGLYEVFAFGDTASYTHQLNKDATLPIDAGEDCDQGGSITTEQPDVHSGTLTADTTNNNRDKAGLVHFSRLGSTVIADGPLWDGTLTVPAKPRRTPDHWFQAQLEFIPDPLTPCTKQQPIQHAMLIGTAQIYNDWTHLCGADEAKDGKNHCD